MILFRFTIWKVGLLVKALGEKFFFSNLEKHEKVCCGGGVWCGGHFLLDMRGASAPQSLC